MNWNMGSQPEIEILWDKLLLAKRTARNFAGRAWVPTSGSLGKSLQGTFWSKNGFGCWVATQKQFKEKGSRIGLLNQLDFPLLYECNVGVPCIGHGSSRTRSSSFAGSCCSFGNSRFPVSAQADAAENSQQDLELQKENVASSSSQSNAKCNGAAHSTCF